MMDDRFDISAYIGSAVGHLLSTIRVHCLVSLALEA